MKPFAAGREQSAPEPGSTEDASPEERIRSLLRHDDSRQLWFQLEEIVEGRTYLKHGVAVGEGDVVLDVGANVGVAAAFFAVGCGAAVVHSFEPVEPIYRLLRENIRDLPACVSHMYGLSSRAGTASVTYYPAADAMSSLHADPERDRAATAVVMHNHGMDEAEIERELEGRYDPVELTCELRTLSSAIEERGVDRVDLLKIDVERAEAEVLAGIDDPDWPRIAQIVAEVHDEGDRISDLERLLAGRGFATVVEQEAVMSGTDVHVLYATRPGR